MSKLIGKNPKVIVSVKASGWLKISDEPADGWLLVIASLNGVRGAQYGAALARPREAGWRGPKIPF